MSEVEQPRNRIIEFTGDESSYVGSYAMPMDKTVADVEKIILGTQDGKMEFQLKFKDGSVGVWNSTKAETSEEQGKAMEELKSHFGEGKFE